MTGQVKDFVKCWKCKQEFDLVKAAWCRCGKYSDPKVWIEPFQTKVCPHCSACLCSNPDFKIEELTHAVPHQLQQEGFATLWKKDEHRIELGIQDPAALEHKVARSLRDAEDDLGGGN